MGHFWCVTHKRNIHLHLAFGKSKFHHLPKICCVTVCNFPIVYHRSAGNTLHCRISLDDEMQWSYIENVKSLSVVKLIEETMRRSEKSVFGFVKQNSKTLQAPFPVRLTNPINRFLEVHSLQSLSRFVIRQHFPNIEKLPLPQAIIEYLLGVDETSNLFEL